MGKVMATELAEDLNVTAVSLLGPDSLAGYGSRERSATGTSRTVFAPRSWA
jgi:hypothetical protein